MAKQRPVAVGAILTEVLQIYRAHAAPLLSLAAIIFPDDFNLFAVDTARCVQLADIQINTLLNGQAIHSVRAGQDTDTSNFNRIFR